jgi:2-polyprenyl-3-methyl-5-hydroxy-6-metoxy-1,4-benzoquinol methylase
MLTETKVSPDLYFDTVFAYQRSAALKTAIELDLFTAIDHGAAVPQEIGQKCGAPERSTRILCDYLASLGFLTKSGQTYALTPDSEAFLSRRSPAYLGGTVGFLHSQEVVRKFEDFTETVRRGAPAASLVADENPAWVQFARAMVPMMMPAAQAIAEILDRLPSAPADQIRVLDIAAGHGIFGIVVAQRRPEAEVVAVDWPSVLEVAVENARAMGVADRYRTRSGDAFKVDYGTGFDVALVTNFLHHFDRPTNVGFLKKVAAALDLGGRVVVLEFVPNEDRVTPPMAARFSLSMLALTSGGDAYTFAELSGMLEEAGFRDAAAHPLDGPQTVVVAMR